MVFFQVLSADYQIKIPRVYYNVESHDRKLYFFNKNFCTRLKPKDHIRPPCIMAGSQAHCVALRKLPNFSGPRCTHTVCPTMSRELPLACPAHG